MSKIWLLVIVVLIVGVVLTLFNRSSAKREVQSMPTNAQAASSPSPFQDLTIPYLRDREYKSQLGDLEKYSENANYITYLTNYDSDGLKINGLLTIPKGEKPEGGWPAIVFVHGYIPPKEYQTTEKYADYIDFIARNGFVVFKIDLRGHGDSEGEPSGGYYSAGYVIDTLNARASLQASDFVNPQKVGLWGHSMAGNILLRSLVTKPDIPAIVIWSGAGYTYTDLSKYGLHDSSYQPQPADTEARRKRNKIREVYGNPDNNNSFWKEVIPTNYLNDIKGSIQLNHAVNDEVVDIGYSRDLNALLDKTSVPHELNEYESGGHNLSGSAFVEAMKNTVDFFNKYLK